MNLVDSRAIHPCSTCVSAIFQHTASLVSLLVDWWLTEHNLLPRRTVIAVSVRYAALQVVAAHVHHHQCGFWLYDIYVDTTVRWIIFAALMIAACNHYRTYEWVMKWKLGTRFENDIAQL